MPFFFLLLFALILLMGHAWPPSWLEDEGCGILVATMMLASWLSAGLIAKAISWQMTRDPEQRYRLLRTYARWRRYHFIALVVAYLSCLFLLGWGDVAFRHLTAWTPTWFRSDENLPGFQIELMIPLFASLLLAWERFHQVEKTAYELAHDSYRFISKSAYLLMQVRQNFIFVMPPIFLAFSQQVLWALFQDSAEKNYLLAGLAFGMMITALVAMPIFLRLFLGLTPLPPGPLRDRLTSTAQRLGFRYANVLVWNTRNTVANAMVTGFIPWVRYIILTDRLIDDLTPDEIEAVFGHEVGHIKHHHLLFYLAFFLTSFILLGLLWTQAGRWITTEDIVALLEHVPTIDREDIEGALPLLGGFVKLGLLAGYALLLFGFISRRCERQADLFGAKTVSTDVFISALERVADINGMSRTRFSWLHPTIDQRIDFLRSMRDQPARITRFNLSLLAMQLTLYAVLGLLLWTFNLEQIGELLAAF